MLKLRNASSTKCSKIGKTSGLPAPATPTVAAPAPMYLAAESISLRTGLVWMAETWLTAAESGLKETFVLLKSCLAQEQTNGNENQKLVPE